MPEDTYIFESITADPDAIHAANLANLEDLQPGREEQATGVVELASQAFARGTADLVDFASDVLATILAQVAEVAGVERHLPQPLTGTATVETDGAETYSLPAGATLSAFLPDQSRVALITTAETIIPAETMSVSGVLVQSASEGAYATLAAPQALEPDQALSWLVGVTLDEITFPGSDGDEDDEYLDRGSRRLALLGDRLILPEDVDAYVRDIDGVGRVLVLDLLDATDPDAPELPVERCMTVVITGPDGSAASSGLITTVNAAVQARREVNFKLFVVRPTYVPVDVELTVAVWPDELDNAGPRVEEAVRAWLHPSVFGARGLGYGDGGWSDTITIRVGEVVSVADGVEGVDYVPPSLVTIDGANADKTMVAPIAALPDPENTTVTVHVVERER